MTEKIKNYLGIAIIIAALVLAASAWSYVRTFDRSSEPTSFRSFSVSGDGKVVGVPDVAEFSFQVLTQGGKDMASLQTDNTNKVNAAIDFVKSKGIDKKDIKTQSYNIKPRYQYFSCPYQGTEVKPCPPPEIAGYTITQSVLVKIRDFSKIGDVLSGVVENGANTVSNLNFTIDDPTELQNQARAEAITKAKNKAKSIAEAGGFSLGRLLSIDESGYAPQPYYRYQDMEMAAPAAGAPSPTIEAGSQDIMVSVTLKYEIQ